MPWGQGPTLSGFMAFIANVMNINPIYLPTNAPIIPISFDVAMSIVNRALISAPAGSLTALMPYAWAVYNLAGSTLLNFAQDQPGRDYFHALRKELGINKFQPGMVASSGDVSTSTGLLNPEFMKQLTMRDLQNAKDPYGRAYLEIAMMYGSSVVELS